MDLAAFLELPREFSVMPFWFWNDALDEGEIVRQIADFEAHGVYGFIIHPRVGLPRELGWMSDRLLGFYRVAIDEARRRGMYVLLYDEGMYPSGSSGGQVVAENPDHQCRCLAAVELAEGEEPSIGVGQDLVAVVRRTGGGRIAVIDRKADGYIRGLHFLEPDPPRQPDGAGPAEDRPPAADILNPDAVDSFLRLVYDRFAERFQAEFGRTILAMFTDEPNPLGRSREGPGVLPGTTGILDYVSDFLGLDFTPHLAALWYDDEPHAPRRRADYARAIQYRLEEVYYRRLWQWCEDHGLPLTGHPAHGGDIGPLRSFHIPGQDLVWRWVLPDDPSALEGDESVQGKCSSSAMIHLGRRRNSNECCGAYGHGLTWEEMKWLADWCFVRGVNLLYPHAFYYSVRGPRVDERPPDVGPNSPWWGRYRGYADYCRRMSWLNTDCVHVCHTAILGEANHLPWGAAKVCFQRQRDFNYLEARHLWEDARVDESGVHIGGMNYKAVILDGPEPSASEASLMIGTLRRSGRLLRFDPAQPQRLIDEIDRLVPVDLSVDPPSDDIRYRHVVKDGAHVYIICNEGVAPVTTRVQVAARGERSWIDPFEGVHSEARADLSLTLTPYTIRLLLAGA